MPPRWVTFAILVFWLGMTSWFCYREIWPYYRPGQPPPISFGLTDEVGGNAALWDVYSDDKFVGTGKSEVQRRSNRTYELSSELKFLYFDIHVQASKIPFIGFLVDTAKIPKITLEVNKLTNHFRVTSDGDLLGMGGKTVATFRMDKLDPLQFNVEFHGRVEDNMLTLHLSSDQPAFKSMLEALPPPEPMRVDHNVLNTMHLLDRLPGLRDGQQWSIPLINPTGMLPGVGQEMSVPRLEASVVVGELTWNGDPTPCWKIEYRQPGGVEAVAATWVRRSDALVVRQEASYAKTHLIFQRQPVKDE